ncbi:hypothetical protein ACJQWK_05368 [Exserohilum turcicum]
MRLQPATKTDLPQLAAVGAAAFAEDAIYGHFHPFPDIYPQDFYDSIFNTLHRLLVTPGALIILLELEGAELAASEYMNGGNSTGALPQEKRIVAYFALVRYGNEKAVAAWNPDSEEKRLQRKLLDIEQAKYRDRSATPGVVEGFYKPEMDVIGDVPERIDARTLAILPEFQRKGLGNKLLAWGYDRVNAEQVPMFGDASKKDISLYLKTGFKLIGSVKLKARTVHLPDDLAHAVPNGTLGKDAATPIRLEELEVPVIKYSPSPNAKRLNYQL